MTPRPARNITTRPATSGDKALARELNVRFGCRQIDRTGAHLVVERPIDR